jgi:hypothetical protein
MMSERNPLEAALRDDPWAVSGLLYGQDALLDEEGRPVSERRAPSVVKQGVPIELRRCPYHDERLGQPMNVSALAQITRHLDEVLEDIGSFRSSLPSNYGGWQALLVAVLDQLAGPALYVLRARGPTLVPAKLSVGHKLAAGFFGVVCDLLSADAQGDRRAVTVDSVLTFVHERRALIGASEVCAGPIHLIARTTEILLHGCSAQRVPSERVAIAEALAAQVGLGLAWDLFDAAVERRILLHDLVREQLRPRTEIIRRALDQRFTALAKSSCPPTEEQAAKAVPMTAVLADPEELRTLFLQGGAAERAHAATAIVVEDLLAHGEGAIELLDIGLRRPLAQRLAGYLLAYRIVVARLFSLELLLRKALNYPEDVPMQLNTVIFPLPKSLRWFEATTGHRLLCTPAVAPELFLLNHQRRVQLRVS